MDLIKRKGYSRIPIYYGENKNFIIGVLIVKSLIGFNVDSQNPKSLRELSADELCIIKTPIYASPNATVGSLLDIFKKGSGHLAIVVENPQKIIEEANAIVEAIKNGTDQQMAESTSFDYSVRGITTLEKIIEQILSTAILDEKDFEKRRQTIGYHGPDGNHQSMTLVHDESHANPHEGTEHHMHETGNQTNTMSMIDTSKNIYFNQELSKLHEKVIKEIEGDVKLMQEKLSINRGGGGGGSRGLSKFAADQEKGTRD